MADAVPSEKLRKYLSELKPEARALLAAELERALLRGEAPPGAAQILEQLRSDARNAGRKLPRARQSAAPVLRAARAVSGRRRAGAQASRPRRARLPRPDLELDVPRSRAAGRQDLCRAGDDPDRREREEGRRTGRARISGPDREPHARGADRHQGRRQERAARSNSRSARRTRSSICARSPRSCASATRSA